MGKHPRARVPPDTPWERRGEAPGSRFWKMLGASLLFHAFLTPVPALLGLVAMLPALDLSGSEQLVEVDLTALPVSPIARVPDEKARPPEDAAPDPDVPKPDEAAEKVPEEPAAAPEPDEKSPAASDPAPDAAPSETAEFGDPVALAGPAGAIADSNANVRLFLFNDVVRNHPLGEKVSDLLRRTPQWRDFFGPAQIDPVADIDKVLIAGPQLRDSAQVVAVVEHNMGRERIRGAFQGLVARRGTWIDEEKLVAQARADRADRIFAAPSDKVVVVAPLKLEKQVRGLGEGARFPPSVGDVAVTAYIIAPANVAKGTGIQLPKSVKWARLDLRPLPDGGAILKILAEDENEEMAKQHALFFGELIKAATTLDPSRMRGGLGAMASLLGVKKQQYLKSVEFESRGKEIHGTIEVTKNQLLLAADFLAGYLPPLPSEGGRAKAPEDPSLGDLNEPPEGDSSQPQAPELLEQQGSPPTPIPAPPGPPSEDPAP